MWGGSESFETVKICPEDNPGATILAFKEVVVH
jgi:hypothetical protein